MEKDELIQLSNKYGTPLFVIDLDKIKENFDRFKKSFGKEVIISYSYKTNYYPKIIKLIDKLGGNPEVVSGMELLFAKEFSDLKKAIFNGPAKTSEELELAIKESIFLINMDNLDELNLLENIAKKLNKKVNIGIRLNPTIEVEGKVSFASEDSKLGMKKKEAYKAIEIIKKSKYLNLVAIHIQLGTQIIDPNSYILAIREIKKIISETDINIEYIDLGGGFANESLLNEKNLSIKNFANEIVNEKNKLGLNQRLIFEPGRYIVDDACFVISKVMSIKDNWVILDSGVNYLIPLKGSGFRIKFLDNLKTKRYDFAGNLCFGADIIAKDVQSPNLKVGDIVKIENCGAYTLSMSEQFIYPFPTIIIKENKKYRLDLKRKTPKEILNFWGQE
jgi:diaminopimelate decarboxylase